MRRVGAEELIRWIRPKNGLISPGIFMPIAEGVEEEQQYNHLKESGCDEIQGYLFGKPCKAAEVEEIFKAKYQRRLDSLIFSLY